MIRKTLTILSLIGLLLSLAAWGVSFRRLHYGKTQKLILYQGLVFVGYEQYDEETESEWLMTGFTDLGNYYGPRWLPWIEVYPNGQFNLMLPLWIPIVVFVTSSISLTSIPAHRRRKRKKLGLCIKCGYDLRGSKDICPECGESFE